MPEDVDIQEFRGQVLSSMRRVYHEHAGRVDRSGGPVEFNFANGTTLFCDAGPDGEAIKLAAEPWVDPFAEPLSEENAAFVREAGKLTAFGVGDIEAFRKLPGSRLFDVSPVVHESGKIIGALLNFDGRKILVHVGADQLQVTLIPSQEQ